RADTTCVQLMDENLARSAQQINPPEPRERPGPFHMPGTLTLGRHTGRRPASAGRKDNSSGSIAALASRWPVARPIPSIAREGWQCLLAAGPALLPPARARLPSAAGW